MLAKSFILNFHDIEPDLIKPVNAYTITVNQLDEIIRSCQKLPVKVHYTFDDGYKSNFTHALKIITKLNVRATFFVSTSNLNQPGFLNERELIAIEKQGHNIQTHGHSHLSFIGMKPNNLLKELHTSKSILESILGKNINQIAFPFGHYNEEIIEVCTQAGFTKFFTTQFKDNVANAELLGRLNIRNDFSLRYIEKLLTYQFPEYHFRKTLSAIKTVF